MSDTDDTSRAGLSRLLGRMGGGDDSEERLQIELKLVREIMIMIDKQLNVHNEIDSSSSGKRQGAPANKRVKDKRTRLIDFIRADSSQKT